MEWWNEGFYALSLSPALKAGDFSLFILKLSVSLRPRFTLKRAHIPL
jgi:hypothetical protein